MPQNKSRREKSPRSSSRSARLDATFLDRLTARPGWTRTILVRRIAAGALVIVSVVLFARDAAATDHVRVVVAARDLAPGMQLQAADVRVADYSPTTVPDGVLTEPSDALEHAVAGPIRAGEPLTDVRLLSPRLAEAAIESQDARVVPIRPTDPAVTELLRAGDTVDVLTVGKGDEDGVARVLASKAVVVLVSQEDAPQRSSERVVLVAMPAEEAATVAAASLVDALTVTFH